MLFGVQKINTNFRSATILTLEWDGNFFKNFDMGPLCGFISNLLTHPRKTKNNKKNESHDSFKNNDPQ